MGFVRSLPRKCVTGGIHVYRWVLSPLKTALLGPYARCRFYPTCSQYALQAVTRYGVLKGLWMSVCRIARCHPWNPGGYDPVPEVNDTRH